MGNNHGVVVLNESEKKSSDVIISNNKQNIINNISIDKLQSLAHYIDLLINNMPYKLDDESKKYYNITSLYNKITNLSSGETYNFADILINHLQEKYPTSNSKIQFVDGNGVTQIRLYCKRKYVVNKNRFRKIKYVINKKIKKLAQDKIIINDYLL